MPNKKIIIGYYIDDLKYDMDSIGIEKTQENIKKAKSIVENMDAIYYEAIMEELEKHFNENNR